MKFMAVTFAVGLASLTHVAQAAPIATLFNTGVDAHGAPLPNATLGDPHYDLISVPSGTTTLRIVTSDQCAIDLCASAYLGDNTSSAWIRPDNGDGRYDPTGYYTYRTTFRLAGLDPTTATISGQWAVDNEGVDILINGISTGASIGTVGTPVNSSFDSFHPFSITSGFHAGVNTLDFVTHNDVTGGCCNPTALRVEMTGTASHVPEPVSFGLFCTGVLGVLHIRRRRALG